MAVIGPARRASSRATDDPDANSNPPAAATAGASDRRAATEGRSRTVNGPGRFHASQSKAARAYYRERLNLLEGAHGHRDRLELGPSLRNGQTADRPRVVRAGRQGRGPYRKVRCYHAEK